MFTLSLQKSQKTGFFLDHRETRQWIREFARGKVVLNAFSYTGAFSVYALAGGAKRVDSVDISEDALEIAKKNLSLNGFSPDRQGIFCEDVFTFLRESSLLYDLVIFFVFEGDSGTPAERQSVGGCIKSILPPTLCRSAGAPQPLEKRKNHRRAV